MTDSGIALLRCRHTKGRVARTLIKSGTTSDSRREDGHVHVAKEPLKSDNVRWLGGVF